MQEATVLRHRPVFDLKWSLLKQVAAVALLCFVVGAAVSVHQAETGDVEGQSGCSGYCRQVLNAALARGELQTDLRQGVDLQRRFRQMDAFHYQAMSSVSACSSQ